MVPPDELYTQYMQRVEALVRTLVGARLGAASDLWTMQLDLLNLQVDLSQEISELDDLYDQACQEEVSAAKAKSLGWQNAAQRAQHNQKELERKRSRLAHILHVSRSVGDAFAWTLFGGKDRLLRPLTNNSRVGSVPGFDARMGVLLVAQEWARKGAGFPVLHDVTNMLRVGDITFIGREPNPVTLEIKTKYEGGSNETGVHRYTVQVWGTTREATQWGIAEDVPEIQEDRSDETSWLRRTGQNDRLRRQLERMQHAQWYQEAEGGQIVQVGDAHSLIVEWTRDEDLTHWDKVRKLAECAKVGGFATTDADEAVFYAAVYTNTPLHLLSSDSLSGEWFKPVAESLGRSRIWYLPPDTHKNTLWFSTTHAYDGDIAALNHRPLLSYPLEEEHIVDILWGRLWFFVGINIGKVAEALKLRGYRVQYPESAKAADGLYIHIWTHVEAPDGRAAALQLGDVQLYATQMLYEALSLEGFVQLIEAVARSAKDGFLEKMLDRGNH